MTPHAQFQGYPVPTSNTTYTPNQFFDVVLPYSSRGGVRLTAYLLRKTLGWCDADGNPQEPQIRVSYRDLEKEAGISRPHIRPALEEAVKAGYIRCVQPGCPKSAGKPAITALYELRWDESGKYLTDPKQITGFYGGEGNRTYIPNVFFDRTVREEPLSVVKVVGAIMRYTIGFQTKYGFRRQQVQMSYKALQKHAQLSSRHLNEALKTALRHNHIQRFTEGFFDVHAGKTSRAATYGIRWTDSTSKPKLETKRVWESEEEWRHRLQKESGNGNQRKAEDRLPKDSGIEIKLRNKTLEIKQQQGREEEKERVAAVDSIFHLLLSEGFDSKTATYLASSYPKEQIARQCRWLRKRKINRNRLGMLRKAIEEDWPEPEGGNSTQETPELQRGKTFAAYFYAGRGGNLREPIAEPSGRDVETAAQLVQRLLEVWPEKERIAEWGRELGNRVREAEENDPKTLISLISSVRRYGDAFFRALQARRDALQRQAIAEAAQTHFVDYRGCYMAYLRNVEERLKREELERYKIWLTHFEKYRFSGQNSEESRLKALAQEMGLPNFWEWDQQHNSQKFIFEPVQV